MLLIFFLALLTGGCSLLSDNEAKAANEQFKKWEKQYNVKSRDITTFFDNYEHVNNHNKKAGVTYKLKLNKFADKEPKVTSSISCNQSIKSSNSGRHFPNFTLLSRWPKMQQFKVRSQGQCGSCYAMVAVGAMEAYYAIHHRSPKNFSVQNVVDCSYQKCKGGTVDEALRHLQTTEHILADEKPYTGKESVCKKSSVPAHFQFKPVSNKASYDDIQQIINDHGPISIGIFTQFINFKLYDEGVFDDKDNCKKASDNSSVDHTVLIVGYGYAPAISANYWLIKNSWGEDWGEKGYMRIAADSQCLKLCEAYYVEKPLQTPINKTPINKTPTKWTPTKRTCSDPVKLPSNSAKLHSNSVKRLG
ncbi:hypothetical protein CHUAL_013004 [Chamberlinius hualienensis]